MPGRRRRRRSARWSASMLSRARMVGCRGWAGGCNRLPPLAPMKILVANLGSTSLKWRLFDFSNAGEQLLHKGGLERVSDYPTAIDECLGQLKAAGHIQSERD